VRIVLFVLVSICGPVDLSLVSLLPFLPYSLTRLADDVLLAGVKSVTDLMTMPGLINLDFADVQSVMSGKFRM
jgi:hypothetical protein